jgi:uncharacterized membrane protein
MSWRSGLLRLWLVGAAAWLLGWTLFVREKCLATPGGSFLCTHDSAALQGLRGAFATWGPLELYLFGFAIPILVLIAGALVVLLVRRVTPR